MRIRIIASIILLFCTLALNAQLSFGIRGGINSGNIKLNNFDGGEYDLAYARGPLGFHVGGIMQIKLLSVFVQPELLFSTTKADVKLTIKDVSNLQNPPVVDLGEQRFSKIDIPIMAGVKLGPLKLQAGPVATMKLGTKIKDIDTNELKQEFSGATLGYQAGVGIELANLLLDVKYEGNLSKLGDGVTIAGRNYSFDQRMNQWILSVGFLFGN